ncbi:23 kDa integral membrane protein-like [Vanessa cardui]|uniref:23 kDa integral membrane protein-like n=1 Tax=Vanessa cardui TaxID=171605 RepID=UPI001F132D31|nr:23 kDa integral membrane protein-like [Vanessa cardui]
MEIQNTQKMKFTKTETEYNMKSIRFLLLTITTMFIIIAGLMIVLGFSVYSHYHTFSFFYESAKTGRFFTPSILSIIMGMFLLIVTLFGFFGSLKQSTCLVNLYAFILALMLIGKLVVVILAFTLDTQSLRNYIYIPVTKYAADPEIAMEIDRLQVCLNCCGSNSYLDYVGMEFSSNQSTVVVSTHVNGDQVVVKVPESCCITRGDEFCTTMRANSCKASLVNLFVQNSSVIGVLGVSVMFIQLLGVIFAILLARCIRKMKSEKTLQTWKIKEQMILARQENEQSTQRTEDIIGDSVYIAHHECSTA